MRDVISTVQKCMVGQGGRCIACLFLGLLSQVMILAQPQYGGALVAMAQNGEPVYREAALLCLLLVAASACLMAQQVLMGKMGESAVRCKRDRLLDRLFSASVLDQESRTHEWYSQRIVNDAALLRLVPGQAVVFVQAGFATAVSSAALLTVAPLTFAVAFGCGMVSFVFSMVVSKPITRHRERLQESLLGLTKDINEAVRAGRVLRAYGAWDAWRGRIASRVGDSYRSGVDIALLDACLAPISAMLMQLANVGVILFGAFQVAMGDLSFSDLVMFLMYFSVFSSSVSQLSGTFSYMRQAVAGDMRITEMEQALSRKKFFLDKAKTSFESEVAPVVRFSDVCFSYKKGQEYVVDDASFSLHAGRINAIVGSSGGGKTTSLGLIEGFFGSSKGTISVNGTDVASLDIEDFRRHTGFVDQGSTILSGTVRNNLLLGKGDASDSELADALTRVGLGQFAGDLDAYVGEGGSFLSGGQKQRLALARALLRSPKLMLLDEPSSGLDGLSERELGQVLRSCVPDTTIVYTAHRLSLILMADWIVVFFEGRVLAQGDHETLLRDCPYYEQIVESQILSITT